MCHLASPRTGGTKLDEPLYYAVARFGFGGFLAFMFGILNVDFQHLAFPRMDSLFTGMDRRRVQ